MAKQPYIPLYTGDYLKDTRMLPLEARGAWVDLMVFMWDAKERGVLVGTMPEYAMLMSCTLEQANFAIGLLQQKGICDFEVMSNGLIKLICRRMVRETNLSKTRSEAGKKGFAVKFAKANVKANDEAKAQANSDNDIDNESDNDNKNISEAFFQPDVPGDEVVFPLDTEPVRKLWATWKFHRWKNHRIRYNMMGEQADLQRLQGMTYEQISETITAAIAANWRNLYPDRTNGKFINNNQPKTKQQRNVSDLAKGFAARHGNGTSTQ